MRLNSAGVLRGCFVPRMLIVASGGVLSIRNRANWIFGLGAGVVLVTGSGSRGTESFGLTIGDGVDDSTGAFGTSVTCLASSKTCFTISAGESGTPEACFGGSVDGPGMSDSGF